MPSQSITVLLIQPARPPEKRIVPASLSSYQQLVGGTIQVLYPFPSDDAALICNDEGKLLGLPLNRPLFDEDGTLYDIIAGTFFIAGIAEDDFVSLSPELIRKYTAQFSKSYLFLTDL